MLHLAKILLRWLIVPDLKMYARHIDKWKWNVPCQNLAVVACGLEFYLAVVVARTQFSGTLWALGWCHCSAFLRLLPRVSCRFVVVRILLRRTSLQHQAVLLKWWHHWWFSYIFGTNLFCIEVPFLPTKGTISCGFLKEKQGKMRFCGFYPRPKGRNLKHSASRFQIGSISILVIRKQRQSFQQHWTINCRLPSTLYWCIFLLYTIIPKIEETVPSIDMFKWWSIRKLRYLGISEGWSN